MSTTEHTSATPAAVCTAERTRTISPRPMRMAMVTFAPMERPRNRPTSSAMTGATPPIAASAVDPTNRPANMASVELKNCCKMLARASGMAKVMILPRSGPCNMSMLFESCRSSSAVFSAAMRLPCVFIR